MLTRWLSIVRWNNFPRVVDIKHLDNVGATLHTALFLAHFEQRNGAEIDSLHLIKKIIFSSLADLVLSDINSGTKSFIKRANPEMFETLYYQAFQYFLDQDAPLYLKKDFQDTLTRKDRAKEDMILTAAKKYVGLFEAKSNAQVYPFIYEVPLAELQKSLQEIGVELPSLEFLLRNESSQKYLSHMYRLVSALRWNMRQRLYPVSVMSHKVIVAYLVYIIGMTGNQQGEKDDILSLLYRAIYHDVPELITGDIVTPTKKAVPGFSELLEQVEKDMLEQYFFRYISPEYRAFLEPYILRPFSGEEGKKAKYADILSALFEAKIEAQKGSIIFEEIYQKIYSEVLHMNHSGVNFLLVSLSQGFMDQWDDIIPPVWDL